MDLRPEVEISRWIAALGRMGAPHPDLGRVLAVLERLQDRPCRLHCLLDGEPGTGKEGLGRLLHRLMHPEGDAPLVRLATSGRSAAELEAEFLDAEDGALSRARGGSLVLEELLDLPASAQRLLQQALKGSGQRLVVIALTDGDAREAVRGGRLRHDLYHRLARLILTLPPLRDRPEDLQQAALWMVNRVFRAQGSQVATLAGANDEEQGGDAYLVRPEALSALSKHNWPGNFRELEAVLERAVLLYSDGRQLTAADVHAALRS